MSIPFTTLRGKIIAAIAFSVLILLFLLAYPKGDTIIKTANFTEMHFSDSTAGAGYLAIPEQHAKDSLNRFVLYPVWTPISEAPILKLADGVVLTDSNGKVPAKHVLVCANSEGAYYRSMSEAPNLASVYVGPTSIDAEELDIADIGLSCTRSTIPSRVVCDGTELLLDRYVSPEFGRLSVCRSLDGVGLQIWKYSEAASNDRYWNVDDLGVVTSVKASWVPWNQSVLLQAVLPHTDYVGTLSAEGWIEPMSRLEDGPWKAEKRVAGAPRPSLDVVRYDHLTVLSSSLGNLYVGSNGEVETYSTRSSNISIDEAGQVLFFVETEGVGKIDPEGGIPSIMKLSSIPLGQR